ncbi:two-component system sensor histidine kinase CpxA [Vespertiliibacter pulmonis]|uniref:histidine kinase n=1 Tax=Vespertiliibacter pulmonis TaxID=1443036 RepID=A0A3N4VX75_9PAST|nr:envelope stress sensor histidine kinase CpxA [Vespertiliibacter pulmonis]QLB21430.1 two-component system sensor histidine kinase CpxA [Vespertiliibacter pulmonis]RPE85845.1 two-component system sensor histidine kinase CpxA [Vespertiliibacter pulmonis]
MRHLWNKINTLRHYLIYQIFSSFFLIFVIILSIVLVLPYFDARTLIPIEEQKQHYFNKESLFTQKEYNLDEVFRRNLIVTSKNGYDVILLNPKSNIISGINPANVNALRSFIFKSNNPIFPKQRRLGSIEIYGPFVLHSNDHTYYQYFIERVVPQQEIINVLFDNPILLFLLLLAICTPLLLWLSWRIVKPVKALRFSADAVATGNLVVNPKLETEGINEFRSVGRSFNRMISALEKLTSYQQRLLSDISHELKTPLTRMQLAVSLIRYRNGESNELTRIENEIQKLDTMIHDLLSLSRQQINNHLHREVFTVNKIWEDVFEDAKFELEQNGLNFCVSLRILHPKRYYINGNISLLSSALENVIRNAKKYAESQIKVMIYIDKNELIFTIDDDGIGVPEHQYEEIFRPFYRVDEARARQTGGTGLGLAIVYNAIQQHKGTVIAEKSPIGGLRIKIQLPLWTK